ncbi:MAG: HPr family phosphocarrier protein [Lachnospiraceae bacterium]
MKSFQYVIKDEVGIHARPAGELAKEAKKYLSTITIIKGDKSAVVTKLMAVMSLGVKCGEEITVTVEGEDEETAFEGIKAFMEAKL